MIIAFLGATLVAAGLAAFVGDIRRATLALWVAGLSVGCVFLTIGAEALAIIQWVLSTLVAISLIFFSVMFGEYGQSGPGVARNWKDLPDFERKRLLISFGGIAAGLAFSWLVWRGAGPLPPESLSVPVSGNDLQSLGRSLTEDHLLSLEVLALTLFLVLIGGGVIARPESGENRAAAEDGGPR